jgi:hypothetical protein
MELFIAGIVTLVTQLIKVIAKTFGYDKNTTTIMIFLIVSIVGATVYTWVDRYHPGSMEVMIRIILLAGGWYSLIIRRFEGTEEAKG